MSVLLLLLLVLLPLTYYIVLVRGRGKIRRTEHAAKRWKTLERVMFVCILIMIGLVVIFVRYPSHPASKASVMIFSL